MADRVSTLVSSSQLSIRRTKMNVHDGVNHTPY